MLIITLLIITALLTAWALNLQARAYTQDYLEVLITLDSPQAVSEYTAHSLAFKLANQAMLGSWLWVTLAASILLATVA